jgi:hypothetical protein
VLRLDKLINELARLDRQPALSTPDALALAPVVAPPRRRPQPPPPPPPPPRALSLAPAATDDADLRSRAGALLEGALGALLAELNAAERAPLGTPGLWSLDACALEPRERADVDARVATLESLNSVLKRLDRDEAAAWREAPADASALDAWTARAPRSRRPRAPRAPRRRPPRSAPHRPTRSARRPRGSARRPRPRADRAPSRRAGAVPPGATSLPRRPTPRTRSRRCAARRRPRTPTPSWRAPRRWR